MNLGMLRNMIQMEPNEYLCVFIICFFCVYLFMCSVMSVYGYLKLNVFLLEMKQDESIVSALGASINLV